jgi:hypothetical protein
MKLAGFRRADGEPSGRLLAKKQASQGRFDPGQFVEVSG